MLCLITHLDDNLSDKVNLNMNWNSSIMTYNYSFIIANNLASDFSEFC